MLRDSAIIDVRQCHVPELLYGAMPVRRLWAERLVVLALLLVLPHLIYFYLWFGDNLQTFSLDYQIFQPGQMLVWMTSFLNGHFPLWMPEDAGGMPFSNYVFAGVYWPVSWFLMLFNAPLNGQMIRILDHVHLFSLGLSGFVFYLWLRRIGVLALPSIFGACVFIFNTRTLDTFRFGTAVDVIVWLPVLVYLIERLIEKPRWRIVAFYAFAQHMLIAPGHLQEALYILLFVNLFALARGVMLMSDRAQQGRIKWFVQRASLFALAQLLGTGISAVLLMPAVWDTLPTWTLRHTPAQEGQTPFCYYAHLTWRDCILNLVYPWYTSAWSNYYCSQSTWLLLAIALVGLFAYRRTMDRAHRRLLIFMLCVFVVGVLYTCGPTTPVGPLINSIVIILKKVRVPARIMTVGMFALATAVAVILHHLVRHGRVPRGAWLVMLTGSVVYILAGLAIPIGRTTGVIEVGQQSVYLPLTWYIAHSAPAWFRAQAPAMTQAMACGIICFGVINLICVVAHRLGRLSVSMLTVGFLLTLLAEASFYHQKGSFYVPGKPASRHEIGLNAVDMYHNRAIDEPPYFAYWTFYTDLSVPDNRKYLMDGAGGRVYNLLVDGGKVGRQIFYQTIRGQEVPRAYVTPAVHLVTGQELAALRSMNPYVTSTIDVQDPVNRTAPSDGQLRALARRTIDIDLKAGHQHFDELNSSLRVKSFTFNKAVFELDTPEGGLFNFSDAYSAGWRATVNGEQVPIYRSNHLFKAIALRPGHQRIVFTYEPASFRYGLIITLISISLVLSLTVIGWGTSRTRRIVVGVIVPVCCLSAAWMGAVKLHSMIYQDGFVRYNPELPVRVIEEHDYFQPVWGQR